LIPSKTRVYVLAEDRPGAEIGIRLALASLFHHVPDAKVVLYWPCCTSDFRAWASQYLGLTIFERTPDGAHSWNCKPQALMPRFEEGYDEAIWLDSDMIVTRNPAVHFDPLADEVIMVTEEPPNQPQPGAAALAKGWGLTAGHNHTASINSSVIRVTRCHQHLLVQWAKLLNDPRYLAAQKLPFDQRGQHFLGDQDVLFSLLGSSDFSAIPLGYLRCGRDIIHCGGALGYSVQMRLTNLFKPVPTFLHAIAGKPWWIFCDAYAQQHPRWTTFYRRLLQETSPYLVVARRFRNKIDMPASWMVYRSNFGVFLRLIGMNHHAMTGLPLTAAAQISVMFKEMSGRK
jgi:hypothetical protein